MPRKRAHHRSTESRTHTNKKSKRKQNDGRRDDNSVDHRHTSYRNHGGGDYAAHGSSSYGNYGGGEFAVHRHPFYGSHGGGNFAVHHHPFYGENCAWGGAMMPNQSTFFSTTASRASQFGMPSAHSIDGTNNMAMATMGGPMPDPYSWMEMAARAAGVAFAMTQMVHPMQIMHQFPPQPTDLQHAAFAAAHAYNQWQQQQQQQLLLMQQYVGNSNAYGYGSNFTSMGEGHNSSTTSNPSNTMDPFIFNSESSIETFAALICQKKPAWFNSKGPPLFSSAGSSILAVNVASNIMRLYVHEAWQAYGIYAPFQAEVNLLDSNYSIKLKKVKGGEGQVGGMVVVTGKLGKSFDESIILMMEHDIFKSFKVSMHHIISEK